MQENQKNTTVFDNLSQEGQLKALNALNLARQNNQGVFDEYGLLPNDINDLIKIVETNKIDCIRIFQDETGYIVEFDENNDGNSEQVAYYDENGKKYSEQFDKDDNGSVEATFDYDTNTGNINQVAIDKDEDGNNDFKERI